jgi:hypothetical protein
MPGGDPGTTPGTDAETAAGWTRVLQLLHVRLRSVSAFLEGSRLASIGAATARVEIHPSQGFSRDLLLERANRKAIEAALAEVFGTPLRLEVLVPSTPAPSPAGPEARSGAASSEAPAARRPGIPEWAAGDPVVQKAMELFDGEIL